MPLNSQVTAFWDPQFLNNKFLKLHEELVRIKREVQQETMGFDNVRFYGGIYYLVSAQTLR